MISYPRESQQLCSVFTQFRNTINIYTEDEEKDKRFYKVLFERLLCETGIVVKDITPLGNCHNVIDACHKDTSTFPKLYIVDGDIDLMLNPKATEKNLYVLDRYCIENFLIDENSVYRVFDEFDYIHADTNIRDLIRYDDIISSIVEPLMDMFRHFAVAKKLMGFFVIKKISCILDKDRICSEKLETEKSFIKNNCYNNNISEEDFDIELRKMETFYPNTNENMFKYVSAKNYLLPYIVDYCKKKLGLSIGLPQDNWKYQFAKHCNIDNLSGLRDRIIKEVKIN